MIERRGYIAFVGIDSFLKRAPLGPEEPSNHGLGEDGLSSIVLGSWGRTRLLSLRGLTKSFEIFEIHYCTRDEVSQKKIRPN